MGTDFRYTVWNILFQIFFWVSVINQLLLSLSLVILFLKEISLDYEIMSPIQIRQRKKNVIKLFY